MFEFLEMLHASNVHTTNHQHLPIFQPMLSKKLHPSIDDIIHDKGNNFESHLSVLDEIFKCLQEMGIDINITKSKLCTKEVKFLRFLLKQTEFQSTQK